MMTIPRDPIRMTNRWIDCMESQSREEEEEEEIDINDIDLDQISKEDIDKMLAEADKMDVETDRVVDV